MCNEVGEKACGFREVLGRLVWDGECEPKAVFILDGLYENSALDVPCSVRKAKNPGELAHLLLIFCPWVIRDERTSDEPAVWDR